jgi:hypothetical protein
MRDVLDRLGFGGSPTGALFTVSFLVYAQRRKNFRLRITDCGIAGDTDHVLTRKVVLYAI